MTRARKKFLSAIGFLLIVFAVFFLFSELSGDRRASASADSETDAKEKLEEVIEDLIASLDTEELQKYLDTLSDFRGIDIKEKLSRLVTGDFSLDYSSLMNSVISFVWEEAKIMLPAFAVILAVVVLCGVLNSAKSSFLNSTLSEIIELAGYLSVGAVVLSCLISVLEAGFGSISGMKKQMDIVYPILLTLMAASGGTVSAGVFRPAVAFMSGGITNLFTSVVLPTSVAVVVLAFVGNLSANVRTVRLGELFKSFNKWIVGLSLGLFSLFLTIQGISSAQYDGLSLRAAKYVISGSVPIVGGFLSGGLDVVLAGSAIIKNAVGSFAVFLLVGTLLRPLLLILVFQLFLRLCAAATEPVGGKISSFLSRLATDSGYFLAGLLCVAFLYFLTLLLLVCSSGVIF